MKDYMLVLTSVSGQEEGQNIASTLVEERLAACVTILSSGQSYYRWQNVVTHEEELIMLIKTRTELFAQLEKKILSLHSYELPEIIGIPLLKGYAKYLNWIDDECTS